MEKMLNFKDMNGPVRFAIALLPLIALGAVILFYQYGDPLSAITTNAPPIEDLKLQRLSLDDEGFKLKVINNGPDTVTIAQVLVDDAYWHFSFEDGNSDLERLETATLRIPYPWVKGEAHEIVVITDTGLTFPFDVEVALETPTADAEQFRAYGLLGVYVGVVPVVLGLLWYPFLRRMDRKWLNLVLALTVGLLVFLVVDTLFEALELATDVPGAFQAEPLIFLVTIITLLAIVSISDMFDVTEIPLFLAYTIAFGIGLHNLGEGLAVGAAFAIGQVSLGTFLVIGFTLHNITEGIGIAAPIARKRPPLYHFGLLALLAGSPAIIGAWIGGFTFNPLWAVIFLSIGAGAILQVIYEVSRLVVKTSEKPLNSYNLLGFLLGIAIMYFTAILVA
jgi:zinc transporter ZupT